MPKNIKLSDIGTANDKTIGGRRIKGSGDKARMTTAFIYQANLKNNSIGGSDRGTNGAAKSYLVSFGCGLMETGDMSKSDYSLLRSTCVVKETIENPNIFDSNAYSDLRNQGIAATDKFPNTDDPFYKLDEGLSTVERKQITDIRNKSGANFIQFAADLYEYTTSDKITASDGTTVVINKSRSQNLISPAVLGGRKSSSDASAKRQAYAALAPISLDERITASNSTAAKRQVREALAAIRDGTLATSTQSQARAAESALAAIRAGKITTTTQQQARAEESALTAIRAGKVSTSTRQQARKETKKKAKKETTLKY